MTMMHGFGAVPSVGRRNGADRQGVLTAARKCGTTLSPMTHRAFAFDYAAFAAELREIVVRALESKDPQELARWIDAERANLTDPYEGEPLADSWRDLLEVGDVHEHGDFALTKYYDGDLDIGLDEAFEDIADLLEESGSSGALTLGEPLGPEEACFDPGRQGTYFQTEEEVASAFAELDGLLAREPALREPLAPLAGMLGQATRQKKGLYVTL